MTILFTSLSGNTITFQVIKGILYNRLPKHFALQLELSKLHPLTTQVPSSGQEKPTCSHVRPKSYQKTFFVYLFFVFCTRDDKLCKTQRLTVLFIAIVGQATLS